MESRQRITPNNVTEAMLKELIQSSGLLPKYYANEEEGGKTKVYSKDKSGA